MGGLRAAGVLTAVVLVAACSAPPEDGAPTRATPSPTATSSATTSTAVVEAARRGDAALVGRLLRNGAAAPTDGTALQAAATAGSLDTVRVLVAAGAPLPGDLQQPAVLPAAAGEPPADPAAALLTDAASGDADGVAVALRAGADLESRDEHQRTALLLAVTNDRLDVARLLVALGADPDALDDRHDTPWLVTGVTGSVPMLEILLPAEPDLTIRNRFGGISVIPAAERGHVDYVRRVVQTGIDVNHVNDPGWTALLEAVVYGDGSLDYQEIVRILLAAGADRDIRGADGRTALDHAEARGQEAVSAILRTG